MNRGHHNPHSPWNHNDELVSFRSDGFAQLHCPCGVDEHVTDEIFGDELLYDPRSGEWSVPEGFQLEEYPYEDSSDD